MLCKPARAPNGPVAQRHGVRDSPPFIDDAVVAATVKAVAPDPSHLAGATSGLAQRPALAG